MSDNPKGFETTQIIFKIKDERPSVGVPDSNHQSSLTICDVLEALSSKYISWLSIILLLFA